MKVNEEQGQKHREGKEEEKTISKDNVVILKGKTNLSVLQK